MHARREARGGEQRQARGNRATEHAARYDRSGCGHDRAAAPNDKPGEG
jgi:hypothetical protein